MTSADFGSVPPHDLDAEAAILSAVLVAAELSEHPLTPDVVSDLVDAKAFYSGKHGAIWESIQRVHARRDPVNVVTVGTDLRAAGRIQDVGGMPYLTELLSAAPVLSEDAVRSHARSVSDLANLRTLLTLAHRVRGECYAGVGDAREYIDRVAGEVAALSANRQTDAFEHIGKAIKRGFKQATDAAKAASTGVANITTGLVELDRKMGGWHPGDLTVVAGRPGMGKSAFAFSRMALLSRVNDPQVESGATFAVVGVSREMPNEQVAMRLVCADADVSLRKLRAGECDRDEWARLTESATSLAKRQDVYLSDRLRTVPELRAVVRTVQRAAEKRGARIGLVVVDYIQLMHGVGDRKGQNREAEVAEISRALKTLALEMRVPVMALAQLNRGVELRTDKRPMLSDLRESGAIEQDADNVLLLYRDDYYNEGTALRGAAEIIVAKQRNGSTGTAHAFFDARRTSFRDLTDAEREQARISDEGGN